MDGTGAQIVNLTCGLPAKYTPDEATRKRLANDYVYHAPKEGQADRYTVIRGAVFHVAQLLVQMCPTSRELSVALTKLDEVVMFANASIARNE